MKVLIVNGDCIEVNSSANLCHLAYIRGLVEAGAEVSLLSADGREYKKDSAMSIPECVKKYSYNGISLYQRISTLKRRKNSPNSEKKEKETTGPQNRTTKPKFKLKQRIRALYGVHGIYTTFLRRAMRFKSNEMFDYLISISTPASSHLLAYSLLEKKHVSCKKWIQIWEDPWFTDVYRRRKQMVFEEEKRLLSVAEYICYVSPITLANQKDLFPESAHKMFWQPLPSYYALKETEQTAHEDLTFGYYGAYNPVARNLQPFFEAAEKTGICVNICGEPENLFSSTQKIHVYPRLPLEKLHPLEDKTDVLVFLCNRKGGQIPGKLYQYASTKKTILFILDGSEEEKRVIQNYFGPFKRFVFCENSLDDIEKAINRITSGELGDVINEPLTFFSPLNIVKRILNEVEK